MGFSVTSTHTIFFIAAVFVAVAVVGVFHGAVNNFTVGVSDRGRSLGDELSTDIRIVTDPVLVPNDPVVLYMMNTGTKPIDPAEIIVLVNGRSHDELSWNILGTTDPMWRTGQVIELTLEGADLPPGDHRVRVIAMHAASDSFSFHIAGGP
jgi:archaeal flagellar protein FlaG